MNKKHILLMIIGCLVPLIALSAIFVFQIKVSTVVLFSLVLLCPALHLLMMRGHMGHGSHQDTAQE